MWIWLFASFLDFSVDLSFGHVVIDSFFFYSIHIHFHMSKAPFSLIIQSLKLLVSQMKWCPGLKNIEMLLFCSRMDDSKYSVFVLKMAPEERPHGCQNPAQILNTLQPVFKHAKVCFNSSSLLHYFSPRRRRTFPMMPLAPSLAVCTCRNRICPSCRHGRWRV